MSYQNYQNNYQNNKSGGGFSQNRPPQAPKKTFEQLGQDVKSQFFGQNYDELLNMSKSSKLDNILKNIEEFVSEEGKNLSTSQLRNIYDKATKARSVNELKLIRPNLAYIAGRSSNDKEKTLLAFIDSLIKTVNSEEKVKEFKVFFEAVVAYHKFHGKNS